MRIGAMKRERGQHGQSTVEFMLMVPVILSIFFFVIEMSLYFSAIHYANYATYTTARARLANYGAQPYQSTPDPNSVMKLVLTGSVYGDNYDVTQTQKGVTMKLRHWKTNFPFLSVLLPNMPFTLSVNLGPEEYRYEKVSPVKCTDNDVSSNPC